MRNKLPIGTEATINGRRMSLRRYTANVVEWFDIEAKAVVKTSHDWKADRKPRDQWADQIDGEQVSAKVRAQIERLASQVGLPVRVAMAEFLASMEDV